MHTLLVTYFVIVLVSFSFLDSETPLELRWHRVIMETTRIKNSREIFLLPLFFPFFIFKKKTILTFDQVHSAPIVQPGLLSRWSRDVHRSQTKQQQDWKLNQLGVGKATLGWLCWFQDVALMIYCYSGNLVPSYWYWYSTQVYQYPCTGAEVLR